MMSRRDSAIDDRQTVPVDESIEIARFSADRRRSLVAAWAVLGFAPLLFLAWWIAAMVNP